VTAPIGFAAHGKLRRWPGLVGDRAGAVSRAHAHNAHGNGEPGGCVPSISRYVNAVTVSYSHDAPIGSNDNESGLPELRAEPAANRRIAELEHQVRTLEARVQRCEAERDELALTCRAAREAERNAGDAVRAGEEILSTVTHDLRNPLGTIVMGATALLHADATADPKLARMRSIAERIHRQAERMTHQIANLGDFAAIQGGRLVIRRASHTPQAIVAAAGDLAGPLARERGLVFDARAAADFSPIDCDGERVVQVLANLVANAVRVTARGGSIEVGARADDGQRIVFFVRDTGPGLPPGELAGLLAPPWHTPPSYQGTTLGFAIARGIVDAHGGQIWADSVLGAGTTVSFVLAPATLTLAV
jgi:signal transduction histidine kinase